MRKLFIFSTIVILAALIGWTILWKPAVWSLVIFVPFFILGFYDLFQTKHTITRNFPIFGHLRFLMEDLRPKIYQYFIESDTNGTPFNRQYRSVVYQRAKKVDDTRPFGTELDVYENGYEWLNHSIAAIDHNKLNLDPRVMVGGPQCKQPYSASVFNISAMSFGSLSQNAILALNNGAKIGNFAHNTGEGGLSDYHLQPGGDIIWQIGTGYFSCRHKDGTFDYDAFAQRSVLPQVKMIEIKLSQGAKPGHGGILPAAKVTPEIARIRLVEMGEDVISPPYTTGIYPDFITVDGGEGGTGAAPMEFSNSVGMPLREALAFVYDALTGFDLKKHIRLIASGKVATGFDLVKNFALGADMCNSARGMMFALGCIQALECNTNTCPTGVATQDKSLMKGLVVEDKKTRVANFHNATIGSAIQMIGAAGLQHPCDIHRMFIYRRISNNQIQTYGELFPYIPKGSLLKTPYPINFEMDMAISSENTFVPDYSNISTVSSEDASAYMG